MLLLQLSLLVIGCYSSVAPYTASWMSHYSTQRFRDIPMIPGTHNSGCISPRDCYIRPIWPIVKNQCLSIFDQLELGVRFLDLRVCQASDGLRCAHRFVTQLCLDQALWDIRDFLTSNPTEFVMLYLQADWDNRETLEFSRVSEMVVDVLGNFLFTPQPTMLREDSAKFPTDTPVASLQGRVILFHDESRKMISRGNLLSFGWKISARPQQMWQGTVQGGVESFRNFFLTQANPSDQEANPADDHISGIFCDPFTIWRTRASVAAEFAEEFATLPRLPADGLANRRPGLVVVDHFNQKISDLLFQIFLPHVVPKAENKDAGSRSLRTRLLSYF